MANQEPSLPADEQHRSGWAAAGLCIGIVGLFLSFIPLMFAAAMVICGLSLIMSQIAYNQRKQGRIGLFVGWAGIIISSLLQLL